MTGPDTVLPAGFQVQIDPRCASGGWAHLLGRSPARLLRMSSRAVAMIDDQGRVCVSDDDSATVARTLLDAGVANPRPMFGPHEDQVTVVIPVRDNQAGIDRLLAALHDVAVIVVDDGSQVPVEVPRTSSSSVSTRAADRPQRAITVLRLRIRRSSPSSTPTWCRVPLRTDRVRPAVIG